MSAYRKTQDSSPAEAYREQAWADGPSRAGGLRLFAIIAAAACAVAGASGNMSAQTVDCVSGVSNQGLENEIWFFDGSPYLGGPDFNASASSDDGSGVFVHLQVRRDFSGITLNGAFRGCGYGEGFTFIGGRMGDIKGHGEPLTPSEIRELLITATTWDRGDTLYVCFLDGDGLPTDDWLAVKCATVQCVPSDCIPPESGDNTAPTANAGDDRSIRAGDTVYLDGSGSDDDNTASASLIYSWSLTSPVGSTAVLAGADTATPSFTADVAGTYAAELVVTDEGGLTSETDEVVISSDNLAPTAVPTVDFSLAIIGEPVHFDGSDSSDPEMDPLTYSWAITAAPAESTATLVGADSATPSLTADIEGCYNVTLTVSDFIGPGTSAAIEIVATTAEDFAEIQIMDSSDVVGDLAANQVTTAGNQNAFGNFLAQAILEIQAGNTAEAIDKLNKAIARTDGCALSDPAVADGNGPGRDWITDCDAQLLVYDLLNAAIDALTVAP